MRLCRLPLLAWTTLNVLTAQRVGAPTDDLEKLSPDELFAIQVTSVGRKAQQLSTAPAAIFVITGNDIRRSGATSIPEALRWAPGLSVLRMDGRSWAISARGGSRLYADKILVMIDGRSLYTPLFSGVIWDAVDVPLEDIEQIEVVRGPGAVMWGPNAVNGVINIITKRAKSTEGALVSGSVGNASHGSLTARWGAADGDRFAYRVWGKLDAVNPAYGSPSYYYYSDGVHRGSAVTDLGSESGRIGFRLEGRAGEKDQLTFQGDLYKVGRHEPFAMPLFGPAGEGQQGHGGYSGGFVQAQWLHTGSRGSESELQFTFAPSTVTYPFEGGTLRNLTVDYQYRRKTGENNEIYWGVGFQQYSDHAFQKPSLSFDPPLSVYRDGDVVVRDEWQIAPGKLMASAGVRLDYNSYRHLEYQPSFRLLLTPDAHQSAWIAWSRAVRVPNRLDRDLRFSMASRWEGIPLPVEVQFNGSRLMKSETERSLEGGYRLQSGQQWSLDVSLFRSEYSRLRGTELSEPAPTSQGIVVTRTMNNVAAGRNWGGEVWGTWQARPGWRLLPAYSYLREILWLPPGPQNLWDHTPSDLRHQGAIRSQHDLSRSLQLDMMARGRSRDLTYKLPGVVLLDARLAWKPRHSEEVSLSVENIAGRHVVELYPEVGYRAIPTRRTFVVKWIQRF